MDGRERPLHALLPLQVWAWQARTSPHRTMALLGQQHKSTPRPLQAGVDVFNVYKSQLQGMNGRDTHAWLYGKVNVLPQHVGLGPPHKLGCGPRWGHRQRQRCMDNCLLGPTSWSMHARMQPATHLWHHGITSYALDPVIEHVVSCCDRRSFAEFHYDQSQYAHRRRSPNIASSLQTVEACLVCTTYY